MYVICLTLTHAGILKACSDFNFVIHFKQLSSVGVSFQQKPFIFL